MSLESNSWLVGLLAADAAILAKVGGDLNAIVVAEPEQRAQLLDTLPADILVREETEIPQSAGSQLGWKISTVYVEIRSRNKQTVHELKSMVEAVLVDKHGRLENGALVSRVRYDWAAGPVKDDDGVTWRALLRFDVKFG